MEDVFPEQMLVPPLPAKLRRRCRVLDGMFAKEFRVYQGEGGIIVREIDETITAYFDRL